VGPSLEGIATRLYIAGELPNTPAHLMRWIDNPPAIRPTTVMPVSGVREDDLLNIAAYLYQLQ
jgi:cytochrome c